MPLRVAAFLGMIFVMIGLGIGVRAGVALLLSEEADLGWATLLGSVYVVGGAVLCGLGTVGEYVGRVYEQVKGRPLYLLKETEADLRANARALPPAA
jgi:dolichol-phosphate mannosyltransferase